MNSFITRRSAIVLCVALVAGCSDDDGSYGEFECSGAECVCPGTGDCTIHCLDACDLQCAGSGGCDFICDVDCNVACTSSALCRVSVGDDSTVSCTGSGGCDVLCAGDCLVECPGSGECIASCAPDVACTITMDRCSGETVTCADGAEVCNGSCPAK